MTTPHARIAIVGGGLAGLVAAWRLQRQGVLDVLLFEARATLGGRIASVDAHGRRVDTAQPAHDRFDLGPSWYWPAMQPQLNELISELGLPARVRRQVSPELLKTHCRAQLARLFGEQAGQPLGDALQDWATEAFTATADDQDATGHHAASPPSSPDAGAWQGRLMGIGSEWSPQFPGYLAGAVDAAERAVDAWLGAAPK